MRLKVLFFCILVLATLEGQSKEFVVLGCREKAGLFSIFNDVLALLKYYEHGQCHGIEIDFGSQGAYYDPELGPNWWSYYCEPICYGEKINVRVASGFLPFLIDWQPEYHSSKMEANRLIRRHIHLKPHIQNKIDSFQQATFAGKYVIGVHYRGTDKVLEAPSVSYFRVAREIQKLLNGRLAPKRIIFVATDEENFISYLQSKFGDLVFYNKEATRSTDNAPLHLSPRTNHVKCGEEALIDSFLLSRTDFLIRTSSNLSLWSTFLNPELKVLELNKRY